MSTFSTLIKTQLNSNFGISALKYRFTKEKKKRWEPILIGFAILVGIGPLLALYTIMMISTFATGYAVGQPEIVLTVSILAAQILVLVFGIFYFLSSFYFSQDMSMLIPLPLKPYEIVGSKFVIVLTNEYLIVLPTFIPAALVYGIGTAQGILYWIKALLVMLTIPAIPLILDALFVMLLMRFVNIRKHKDLFAIIGGMLGMFLAVGVNVFMQKIPKNGTDYLKGLLDRGLVNEIGSKFPPSIWATKGLSDNGLMGAGNFLLFIGVAAALFFVMLWLANLVFYKGVLSGQEVTRKRKVLTSQEMVKTYNKSTSPVLSLFIREWRLLVRTPVYMINGIAGSLIGPIMLAIIFMTKTQSSELIDLFAIMRNPEYLIYVTLGGLGFILFTGGMNLVASTSVSREGSSFWIAKMIPVSAEHQVLAKLMSGYMVVIIGTTVTTAILVALLGFSLPRALTVAMIGLLAGIPMTAFNLLLDLMHPKLVWNNPQEAMKQNMNGILGMLISFVVMGILAVTAIVPIMLEASEPLIYLALAAVSILLGVLSVKLLFAAAKARYSRLEV